MIFSVGDLDICYYNFECLAPWGSLLDFGHVFSNIGYIIYGLAFSLIVYYRQKNYNNYVDKYHRLKASNRDVENPHSTGIPEQFGIYYAMAAASVGEGVLSACYHICPTGVNFQFDTTFMYSMAVLIFLKVFQFRHSDITPSPYKTYLLISFMLTVEVAGYFVDNLIFWIVFSLSYVVIVHYVIVNIYCVKGNSTTVGFSFNIIKNILNPDHWKLKCFQVKPVKIVVIVNLGTAIFFLYDHTPGVSTYILLILMMNMQMYFMYYLYCKIWYAWKENLEGERIGWTSLIYIAVAVTCVLLSGNFLF